MADFAPPTGPPPPKVPEGWKAIWNDQYKEWFYVNIHTKKSQWEKPDSPVYSPPGDGAAPEALPAYDQSTAQPVQPEKTGSSTGAAMFGAPGAGGSHQDISGDEAMARKLQEEEDARHRGAGGPSASNRGAADSYYSDGQAPQYGQTQYNSQQNYSNELPPDTRAKSKGGFLGKLLGKGKSSQPQQQYYPQQGYPQQGYHQQGQYYPPQQGYYPGGGPAVPGRKPGMGAGGAAALGVGGGLLGGMLLADAVGDHHGGDDGGYGGGDDGGDGGGFGGDDGGGFGGDDGGGDFGGDF